MHDIHAKTWDRCKDMKKSHAKAVLQKVKTTRDIAMTELSPNLHKCQPAIEWSKNPLWTNTLVVYLSEHTTFFIKLFSDLTAAAKKAGVDPNLQQRTDKPQQWAVLAISVFADDEDQKELFKANPGRFASSVDTCM